MSLTRMTIRRVKRLVAWALAIIILLLIAAGVGFTATAMGWI